jgi:hypothetical protein
MPGRIEAPPWWATREAEVDRRGDFETEAVAVRVVAGRTDGSEAEATPIPDAVAWAVSSAACAGPLARTAIVAIAARRITATPPDSRGWRRMKSRSRVMRYRLDACSRRRPTGTTVAAQKSHCSYRHSDEILKPPGTGRQKSDTDLCGDR